MARRPFALDHCEDIKPHEGHPYDAPDGRRTWCDGQALDRSQVRQVMVDALYIAWMQRTCALRRHPKVPGLAVHYRGGDHAACWCGKAVYLGSTRVKESS